MKRLGDCESGGTAIPVVTDLADDDSLEPKSAQSTCWSTTPGTGCGSRWRP
jgi:hypothetical protein